MAVEILDSNRTIFVAPLNENAGEEPVLTQCKSTAQVFATYEPGVEIEVKNDQGESETDAIRFNAIKDFSVDSVISQSPTLEGQRNEQLILADFLKLLKSNATLRKALSDPAQRDQLLGGLKTALNALGGEH
ncbi:MAG: type VI secretion system contractile sheath small subunit [Actinomycetia bacterium]|nr:type VI secretion system contractile sheath small subunit [Actinomycetes bacterium]